MLKILQVRLQQYMNWEFPDAQARLQRGRGNRSNCQNLLDYGESIGLQKNCYFCFIDYAESFDCAKAFDYVYPNKLWKILQKMGIPGHLTCLRNLYAGQKATVRTAHVTTVDSKLGKEDIYSQGCILSPCLFNLNAKYIMWNAILEEAQAGIKTAVEI